MTLTNTNLNLNDLWIPFIATWTWFWTSFTPYIASLFFSIFSSNLPPVINLLVIIFAFIILLSLWAGVLFLFLLLWAFLLTVTTVIWFVGFLLNQIFGFGWISTSFLYA